MYVTPVDRRRLRRTCVPSNGNIRHIGNYFLLGSQKLTDGCRTHAHLLTLHNNGNIHLVYIFPVSPHATPGLHPLLLMIKHPRAQGTPLRMTSFECTCLLTRTFVGMRAVLIPALVRWRADHAVAIVFYRMLRHVSLTYVRIYALCMYRSPAQGWG